MTIEQAIRYIDNHPKLDASIKEDREAVLTLLSFSHRVLEIMKDLDTYR